MLSLGMNRGRTMTPAVQLSAASFSSSGLPPVRIGTVALFAGSGVAFGNWVKKAAQFAARTAGAGPRLRFAREQRSGTVEKAGTIGRNNSVIAGCRNDLVLLARNSMS